MRHRVAGRKLGRTSAHRLALMRNMSVSLFRHERIRTTVHKAKELRSFAERLITRAKSDSVHARRVIARDIRDRDVARKLFETLAPRYVDRPGGYTRILRLGPRPGDGAEMVFIELVDAELAGSSESKPAAKKAAPKGRLGRLASRVRGKTSDAVDAGSGKEDEAASSEKAAKKPAKTAAKKKATKKKAKAPEKTAGGKRPAKTAAKKKAKAPEKTAGGKRPAKTAAKKKTKKSSGR